ncbi:hypothetical protein G6F46_014775 [Rhizopus delemar]|nr:hypothetical protein G6F46_014775 [Rhizopus delemar]
MRAKPDGDQAYAAGDGLPDAIRLYTAAAVDIRSAAPADADAALARARARLLDILALPERQGAARSVWAAYMLAELGAGETGDAAVATPNGSSAATSWPRRRAPTPSPHPH